MTHIPGAPSAAPVSTASDEDVRRIERLELDRLAPGRLHLLRLQLGQDGLGRALRVPIMVVRGRRPGPCVGLTAAVHGNELNGIPVIHRVLDRLDPHQLRGTVVGVVAMNLPGLLLRQRRFADGVDLNHVFPGKEVGTPAQVYVHQFVQRVLPALDRLIDLHTASFGRVNSLYIRADMDDPDTARMAMLQRPEIIVHNPPADQTLRGTAAVMGVPAITVEIGNPHRFHRDYIRQTVHGVRRVLVDLGMLRRRRASGELPLPVVCESSRWLRTTGGGLLTVHPRVTTPVAAGEELAVQRDEFGRELARYHAPEAGVVIGRSVDPLAPTGTRFVHLGVVAPPDRFDLPLPAATETDTTSLGED